MKECKEQGCISQPTKRCRVCKVILCDEHAYDIRDESAHCGEHAEKKCTMM